jgi:hypothetical protein
LLGRTVRRRCRRDPVRERAVLDPGSCMPYDEVALGIGQVLGGGPGDVTRPHRSVDPDLRRSRPDQPTQAVLRVTCVM